MKTLFSIFEKRTPFMIWWISCLIVLLIAILDFLTSSELSIKAFYAIPVILSSWYGSARSGILLACFIATINLVIELIFLGNFIDYQIGFLDINVVLIANMFLAIVITNFRKVYRFEESAANTDLLTGLCNMRGFYEMLSGEVYRAERYKHIFTVVYIDIDNFKRINDTQGHFAGDKLLVEVANSLRESLREADVVARLGGDEFALLMPETDSNSAKTAIKNVIDELTKKMKLHGWSVSFSIGSVTFLDIPKDPVETLKVADCLMYKVKNNNKNAVAFIEWTDEYKQSVLTQ